jgi:GntR family transcriptional regulator
VAHQPLYQRIADDLRGQIESGALTPGAQLPTELELREAYAASRNTVRDAVKRLTGLGLVETRAGQGTFVTRKIDPFVTVLTSDPATGFGGGEGTTYLSQVSRDQRTPSVGQVRVETKGAPAEIARQLRLGADPQVVLRHQERFIDRTPWSRQTSFFPLEFVTSGKAPRLLIAQDIETGTVRYLEEVLGIRQASYRDWITARAPDASEQGFFGISHDATVLVVSRTAFDQAGQPMRVTVTVFPADRNHLVVDVGKPPAL